jgi:hypothetical protein
VDAQADLHSDRGGPDQVFSLSTGGGGGGGGDHYSITNEGGGHSIVPGTDDLGSACDDCNVPVSFPFPVTIYCQNYTSAMVSSNGNLQFNTDTQPDYSNTCLPAADHGAALMGFWYDGYTLNAGYGIFTTTTGSEPDRTFYIEFRGQYYPGVGSQLRVRVHRRQRHPARHLRRHDRGHD